MLAMMTSETPIDDHLATITETLEGITILLQNQERRIDNLAEKVKKHKGG